MYWIDYCNAVLHGTPTGTIYKLQGGQNNAARIVLQVPRRFQRGRDGGREGELLN